MMKTTKRKLMVAVEPDLTNLTTVATVKTELAITGTTEDAYLLTQINRATAAICSYLGVSRADDGTNNLGLEILLETIYPNQQCNDVLLLSRHPVVSIESVTEAGIVIDPADYLIENNTGTLTRRCGRWVRGCSGQGIAVAYTAGWVLPPDGDRNLPHDIEAATIGLIKLGRFNRSRDPTLRSENILEGLYSYTLFGPSDIPGGIPPDVAATLNRYRNYNVP